MVTASISFILVSLHTCMLSHVHLSATLWAAVCQAPLSMGFSRQEHWSGLPFPPSGDLPDPGTEPVSPALQVETFFFFFTAKPFLRSINFSLADLHSLCSTHMYLHFYFIPLIPSSGFWEIQNLSWIQFFFYSADIFSLTSNIYFHSPSAF